MQPSQEGARIGEGFVSYVQLVRPVLDRLRAYQRARDLESYSDTIRELLEIAGGRVAPVPAVAADPSPTRPGMGHYSRCGAPEPGGDRSCRLKEGHPGAHLAFCTRGPKRARTW